MADAVPKVINLDTLVSNRNRKKTALLRSQSSVARIDGPREHLLLAVEEGLSVLGENVSNIVFDNLNKRYSLHKREHY